MEVPGVSQTITFNAPLFYIALELLTAFFCFMGAMLFAHRARLASVDAVFRPRLLWTVGSIYTAHCTLLLFFLDVLQPWMFLILRFLNLGVCWSLVLFLMLKLHKYRPIVDTLRLLCLAVPTVCAAASVVVQLQANEMLPIGYGGAFCWLIAFGMFYEGNARDYIAMPVSYRAFCLLGFLAHLVVITGSRQFLDGPFFLGCFIRTTQYGHLVVSLLLSQFFGYSAEVWAQRQVLESAKDNSVRAGEKLVEARQGIEELKSHIRGEETS